jgi:hypothetical protein
MRQIQTGIQGKRHKSKNAPARTAARPSIQIAPSAGRAGRALPKQAQTGGGSISETNSGLPSWAFLRIKSATRKQDSQCINVTFQAPG